MSPRAFAGLEYLEAAVLTVGNDGCIIYANPALKTLFALRDCDGMTLASPEWRGPVWPASPGGRCKS